MKIKEVTENLNKSTLKRLMEITYKKFSTFFRENRSKVFSNDFDFDIEKVLSDQEKEKRKNNWEAFRGIHRYYLVAKVKDEIIAWAFGMQKSAEDYYMINSAVLPNYRRQGIYTQMMKMAVDLVSRQGFQRIYSKHKMCNNHILIPKLKFGFIITGFEVNDTFGNLVELSYYTNPVRRELLEIRIGTKKPDSEKLDLIE